MKKVKMNSKGGNNSSKKLSHSQQNGKNSNKSKKEKKPTLTLNKRNELNSLVKKLLVECFRTTENPTDDWEQFIEINDILKQIRALETVLNQNDDATPAERLKYLEEFKKWAFENGCECNGATIAEFPGYDLGLKVERKIKEGESIIIVPRKAMLSEENIKNNLMPPKFDVMSNIKLTYALIFESVSPASFWAPYIKIMPKKFTSVGFYSVENMEQLRGSNVLPSALKLWKSVARQYAFVYDVFQNQMPKGRSEIGDILKNQFCYDLYRWGMAVVMTRENMIPRSVTANVKDDEPDFMIALVPFWDMINHRSGSLTTVFDLKKQHLEMTAPVDFEPGEQLFMHYGKRCNADMLLHNGFVDVDNANDYVPLKLGLSKSDPLCFKRSNLFKMVTSDCNKEHYELNVLPAPDYFSAQLLAFVRIFNMNELQLDHWLESDRAQDLKHMDCALETQLEQKTWQYLKTRMMLNLRSFPTTLEQDEQRLDTFKKGDLLLGQIEANILQYLVLEKRILQAALEYANQRIKT